MVLTSFFDANIFKYFFGRSLLPGHTVNYLKIYCHEKYFVDKYEELFLYNSSKINLAHAM